MSIIVDLVALQGSATNSVQVSGVEDEDLSNNSDECSSSIVAADLELSKSCPVDVIPGVQTSYTVDVSNVGSVTAINVDDLESIAISGGLSGVVDVQMVGTVNVMHVNTAAFVEANARVNTDRDGVGADQSVLVAAGNDFYHMGIAGAASLSGVVSVGPASDVTVEVAPSTR